jgi:hypothetical protein
VSDRCTTCGNGLGFFERLRGKSVCPACAEQALRLEQDRLVQKHELQEESRAQYQRLIRALARSDPDSEGLEAEFSDMAAAMDISPAELERMNLAEFRAFLMDVLADDELSVEEEQRMNRVAGALGIGQSTFESTFGDLMPRLFVARANAGRLPVLASSRIILRRNEVAHMDANADLMKEVVDREWRSGSSGFSFRIAKGVRYRVGSSRGHMVVLGSHIAVDDSGFLTITSRRAVFTGVRRSLEMPYTKLLSLSMFQDGVQFHLSNRKTPPLFRLSAGIPDAVAAAINTAAGVS